MFLLKKNKEIVLNYFYILYYELIFNSKLRINY